MQFFIQRLTRHFRPWAIMGTAIVIFTGVTGMAEGLAEATPKGYTKKSHQFHIPAQPLPTALTEFASQSGLFLVYKSEMAEGQNTEGLNGQYSPEEALEILLKNTQLGSRITDLGTITIYERAALPSSPSSPEDTEENVETLPEITVIGMKLIKPTPTSISTKSPIPIMQTPMSIQTVPEQVLKDQRTNRLDSALENVSNLQSLNSAFAGYVFNIRGFRSFNLYRNSLLNSVAVAGIYDTANLDRVEIVKGPASLLYGRIDPGGLINLVPKRPLDRHYFNIEQEFGSYQHYRTVWDATGPMNENKTFLARFTGAYQNSDSFRDFHDSQRLLFHPSVSWRPSDSTSITVELEYFEHHIQNDPGIPVIGNRPANIPISRSFQEPNDPLDETHKTIVGLEFSHAFDHGWRINNKFHYISSFLEKVDAAHFNLLGDNRTLEREVVAQQLDSAGIYNNNINVTGDLELWNTRHQPLAGFDYNYEMFNYFATGRFADPNGVPTDPISNINIFNPTYSGLSAAQIRAIFDAQPRAYFPQRILQKGIYFQDHITLFDVLHIQGGARYDWTSIATGFSTISAQDARSQFGSTKVKDEEFSPHVGILYQPWPEFSLYGSWSNSFQNNSGFVDSSGRPLPNQDAEQWEAGIKTELFDKKLRTTMTYFHLTRKKVATPDLNTVDAFDSVAVGEERSRGFELDVLGQITDEIGLIGNYAYLDTKITKDNAGLQGNRQPNAPTHSGSLFLTYQFKQYAPLNGLRFGMGMFAMGERKGDIENTFILPGFVRLDAFASYTQTIFESRVTAQINITNLLDKKYYTGSDQFFDVPARLGVYPGAPLTAIGLLRIEFGQ